MPISPHSEGSPYKLSDHHKARPVETIFDENGCEIITSHKAKLDNRPSLWNPLIKKYEAASRVFYHIYVSDPGKDHVLHKDCCKGNDKCVNINHLRLGSNLDNIDDRVRLSRSSTARGSANGKAKLNEEIAYQIKKDLAEGKMKQNAIARKFGIDHTQVSSIKRGVVWAHVIYDGEINPQIENKGSNCHNSKLTEEQVIEIKTLLKEGKVSQAQLAKTYGVSGAVIFNIKNGLSWAHIVP